MSLWFDEIARSREAEFFRRKDAELLEHLRHPGMTDLAEEQLPSRTPTEGESPSSSPTAAQTTTVQKNG